MPELKVAYYGSKISDNMVSTPEGYLICRNVPIGRTGWMKYRGEEIGIPEMAGQMIDVYRSADEVFSPAAMASFEGKPTTNDHPKKLLSVDDVQIYVVGHVQNVRREGEYLLADLLFNDKASINAIENGKREVSSGYDCLWIPLNDDKTKWEQKEIIGNHVAIVTKGRAGDRVAILDAEPEKTKLEGRKVMPKQTITKAILTAIGFKAFAQDAEPEQIAEAMKAMNEMPEEGAPEEEKDLDAIGQVLEAIKALGDRISALEQSDKSVHKELGAEDEFKAMEEEEDGCATDAEASEVIEPEEKEEEEQPEKKMAVDSAVLQAAKKAIMAIPDEKTRNEAARNFRKAVSDAKPKGENGYAKIINAVSANKSKAMDSAERKTQDQVLVDAANAFNAAGQKMRDGGK